MEQPKYESVVLEIKDLHIDFLVNKEYQEVVHGISFQVEKGKILGVVGESGSGKSVSALAIMQLLPAKTARISRGEIIYYSAGRPSQNLTNLPSKFMQTIRGNKIAMIFQEPMTSLNPVYTCGKQVMEMLEIHRNMSGKEAKREVLDLFEKVLLPRPEKIFDSYPHQLSGGQKQRVMIAMALSCKPDILIADEPTTALDVTVQKSILELLKSLQQQMQMGIIFITHDLGVVSEIADNVIVLYKGEIVEKGKVEDIFENPKHPYTQGLLACRPTLNARPLVLKTVADFLDHSEVKVEYETLGQRQTRQMEIYSGEPILKIDSLLVSYPLKKTFFGKTINSLHAVDEVSFSVYEGETLGLVGESGCGKTTLGRAILQLANNESGNIIYKGTRLNKLSANEMRKFRQDLQIIFQDPYSSLNPRLMAGEAIIEPMRVFKIGKNEIERKENVIHLLERVGLNEESYYRYPHEFSGGQRQRICIARTLAVNPKLIICDESVSALDVSVQAQVLNLLNELKHEFKLTYIFISHDLSVVKYMSDRMLVMQNGKIVEIGEADQIYESPSSEYTRKLINAIPK